MKITSIHKNWSDLLVDYVKASREFNRANDTSAVQGGGWDVPIIIPQTAKPVNPLTTQVGGDHYKNCKIQPVEYIMANELPWCEANIVKLVTRHKQKGGRLDIEKTIHYAQVLLKEYDDATKNPSS